MGDEYKSETLKQKLVNPTNIDKGEFLDYRLDDNLEKAYEIFENKDYFNAIDLYHEILRHNIKDFNSIYILAACYGYLGQADLAAKYLLRASNAGFDNFDHVDQNKAFDLIRDNPSFKTTVCKLKNINKEKVRKNGEKIYIDSDASFKCLIKAPEAYSSDKNEKLIVGLHGRGNTPEEFMDTLNLSDKGNGFIHVAPCGQYPFLFNNKIGYSWNFRVEGDDNILAETTSKAISYIMLVIKESRTKYKIDETYIAGFSQGASFALLTGILNPENIKGIISFSGWLPKDWLDGKHDENIQNAKGLHVFLTHGRSDSSIPFEYGIKTRDKLDKAGLDVTFIEFDGGHTILPHLVNTAYNWLSKIK
jgi:phospholipase/carboxylesterase